jgi:hypothetical protein
LSISGKNFVKKIVMLSYTARWGILIICPRVWVYHTQVRVFFNEGADIFTRGILSPTRIGHCHTLISVNGSFVDGDGTGFGRRRVAASS